MVDYTVDTETGKKIEGKTTPASFIEYWCLTRKENIKSSRKMK